MWFFRNVDIEVYGKSLSETLFHNSTADSSFQVKITRYLWTQEETECFVEVMEEKTTTTNILDSKELLFLHRPQGGLS